MQPLPPEISSQQRQKIFFQELENLNIYPESLLTQDEILRALDHKLGSQFDRYIAEQLFQQLHPDVEGRIYMQDFCLIWIQAQDILRKKIEKSEEFLNDNIDNREEAARKLDDTKRTERLNANGIMQGSTLTVNLEHGENFVSRDGQPMECFVVFTCGRQSFKSVDCMTPQGYAFKQEFGFGIDYGTEVLKIEVYDRNMPQSKSFYY